MDGGVLDGYLGCPRQFVRSGWGGPPGLDDQGNNNGSEYEDCDEQDSIHDGGIYPFRTGVKKRTRQVYSTDGSRSVRRGAETFEETVQIFVREHCGKVGLGFFPIGICFL